MSPLAKLGIAAVVIIFVGGALAAGGLYYVAHRVSQKIHEEAGSILGSSSDSAGPIPRAAELARETQAGSTLAVC